MAEILPSEFAVTVVPPPVLTEIQQSVRLKLAVAGDEAEFTPEEMAEKLTMPVEWVRKNQHKIPGRFLYSNKCVRFHWGTHKQEMRKRNF